MRDERKIAFKIAFRTAFKENGRSVGAKGRNGCEPLTTTEEQLDQGTQRLELRIEASKVPM